jgi:hypothetical protein
VEGNTVIFARLLHYPGIGGHGRSPERKRGEVAPL